MRFVLGAIPETRYFFPKKEGWIACKELNPKLVVWLVGPTIALLVGFVLLVSVHTFTKIQPDGISLLGFLAVYPIIIVIHETIHAVFHPDSGLSEKTIMGFWPTRGIFFAHYEGSRSRTNFLIGIIAPFTLLTIVPLILAIVFDWTLWIVGVAIIWNGLSSAIDILGFFNVLVAVPRNAKVRNLGWFTYYQHAPPLSGNQ